jgi:glycosyltransferase involved in cell wall biosynthesis
MSEERQARLRYNIDNLVVKGDALLCWGWIFDENGPLSGLRLRLTFVDGGVIEQAVAHGTLREDVREAFAHSRYAAASGFMTSHAWNGAELAAAMLIVTTADGKISQISLHQRAPDAGQNFMRKLKYALRQANTLGLRALGLIRQRRFDVLRDKMRRYLASRPQRVGQPVEVLRSSLRQNCCGTPALLVIDHDMGGGATHYRNQLIEQRSKEGKASLLLTFHVPTLSFAAQVYGPTATGRIALPELSALQHLSREGLIRDIFYNNSVSFLHPERVPYFVTALRKITSGKLVVAVHDFNMVCPSHFLLDDSGKYCDVPEVNVCENCLQRNQEGFVNFFHARDIRLWRKSWRQMIDEADELIFFSEAAKRIFLKSYADADTSKWHVRPHAMDYFPARVISVPMTGGLHIGVVGNIGKHKGAQIIAHLADAIKQRGRVAKITIFGMIDVSVPKEIVTITGPYSHQDLPALIERSGVNLMLLPSIFPETFSYVTHELIRLGLPVVSFDLGAQAEALREYARGRIIQFQGEDGQALLDTLMAISEDLLKNQRKNE